MDLNVSISYTINTSHNNILLIRQFCHINKPTPTTQYLLLYRKIKKKQQMKYRATSNLAQISHLHVMFYVKYIDWTVAAIIIV